MAVAAIRDAAGSGAARTRTFFATASACVLRWIMAAGPLSKSWILSALSVADREVHAPQRVDMLFFRGSVALFLVVVVLAAGTMAWQAFHIEPGTNGSDGGGARKDHSPADEVPVTSDRAALNTRDAAATPVAAAQEGVTATIAPIPDIDAEGWFDITTVTEPEEPIAVVLAVGPRARPRPDAREKVLIAGIPMEPEPPVGTGPRSPLWLANAVPAPQTTGKRPMIAIVIDDAGVARERTRRASLLPAPLTIAFIPYANDLESQTRYARARGHELLVHLPMEPSNDAVDPGRNALLTSLSREEIMRRFRWALDRFDGYVGVNNHMGSKFMARPDLVRPVLEEINARGLLFLDSRTDRYSVGTKLARDMAMPHATRNVFLDNELDAVAIWDQLGQVERVARRNGHAIAIGHPHDVTVDVLAAWLPEARRRGFSLVPVSAIVKKEYETLLASAAAGGEANSLLGGAQ